MMAGKTNRILHIFLVCLLTYLACNYIYSLNDLEFNGELTPENYAYSRNMSEVTFDYTLPSSSINTKKEFPDGHILGLHQSTKNISVEVKYVGHKGRQYITFLKINMDVIPQIFVANEILGFQCTLDGVIAHERTHYNFEKQVLDNSPKRIKGIVLSRFKWDYASEAELQKGLDDLKVLILDDFQKELAPLHGSIDTMENYRMESSRCSQGENRTINAIINRNNLINR